MAKFFAYILRSISKGGYYYGSTSDLDERIRCHNSGKVKSTKHRRPLELIYVEEFELKSEAIKRENFFKSIDGYNWLKSNNIT